jgi:hypothetical protein
VGSAALITAPRELDHLTVSSFIVLTDRKRRAGSHGPIWRRHVSGCRQAATPEEA